MLPIAILCIVAATTLATPVTYDDIDTVILIFPLVSTQNKGGNVAAMLSNVEPYLTKKWKMNDSTREMFLTAGGLSREQAKRMISDILPVMAREGKSTREQLMALMFMSNQFCIKRDAPCNSVNDSAISYMTMGSKRGCRGNHILAGGWVTSTDECVCDDQDNLLLWISLLDKVQRGAAAATEKSPFSKQLPNQIPVILLMMLAETPCDGKLQGRGTRCQCSAVTEGNEGLLTQLVVDEPQAKQILSPLAKDKIQQYSREPATRQLGIQDLLFLRGGINPALLPIFLNDGASMQEKLTQYFLSLRGFDSATVQLILSGGLTNDKTNKVALINYLANRGIVSPDAVPFLAGVDKGSTFYLQSMIESGAIDPVLGALLLAKQTGTSQSNVFALISQLLTGKTVDLTGLGKPYIPELPEGIFPGSKLYFAHLEALGINTCALHDLRNRFNCGFEGIGAAQCEVRPYCCYNPVFLTDAQVSEMTQGNITDASTVPWCYYNVFYIYYNSFALTVKRPGQFASPSSCLPLFKYSLNIDPSVYYVYAKASGSSALNSLVNIREECGFPGITEFHCVAIRGCCWDKYSPFRIPQCFKINGDLPTYDLNSVPAAYQPRELTCSVNYYQFPILYYRRIACMPSWNMFIKKGNPLKLPNKYECLWELGCCWEENDTVIQKFPNVPRCYQREDGGYVVQPSNIAQLADLITRIGSISNRYPPVQRV